LREAASFREWWIRTIVKKSKIVKMFVNGDKNQVNLENTVRCTCIYRGRYCREQASESAHAIRDDSGAISANVRTVALFENVVL